MKLFIAGMATETNCFSPIPTGAAHFVVVEPGDTANGLYSEPQALWRRRAAERDWQVVDSLCACAQPAGPTVRKVYEDMRDRILGDLERALPVDVVLLTLHGAMVADGYDDCEGDLLARVRTIAGPGVAIGAELDLHCTLTDAMTDNATALISYKQYPHVDYVARAAELFDLMADAAAGHVRPVMSVFDCRMIDSYHTTVEPMKGFVREVEALEGKDGVLSISIGHGFPWADVPDAGTKILVVTDGRREQGDALAATLGRRLFAMRGTTHTPWIGLDEGLDKALASTRHPVVIADMADNPGGGAPGDSTFVIRAMLARGIDDAAVALLYDPGAVELAKAAGVGAALRLRIGGKTGPMSGDPLDVAAKVTAIAEDATMKFGADGRMGVGDLVAIRVAGIDIVMNTRRTQPTDPECFSKAGIDPTAKRILVVKSSAHFRAGFEAIAGEILQLAGPGALDVTLASVPFERIKRPKWPLDDDPFAAGGA